LEAIFFHFFQTRFSLVIDRAKHVLSLSNWQKQANK